MLGFSEFPEEIENAQQIHLLWIFIFLVAFVSSWRIEAIDSDFTLRTW